MCLLLLFHRLQALTPSVTFQNIKNICFSTIAERNICSTPHWKQGELATANEMLAYQEMSLVQK